MKKIFFIAGMIFLMISCDVLNVEPLDSINADAAFKDKAGIERGILGSYSSLQSLSYFGRSYILFTDLSADNLVHPADATATSYAEIATNSILPENSSISGVWAVMYDGINITNNVIDKVPGIPNMSDEEKNEALAELYFIRALNHFNLMNFFGPIPIKIKPTIGVTELDAGRDSKDAVYTQIITDLTFAETHLKASSSMKIRATKFAAKALLARVYLYKGDDALAWDKANDVILNGGYDILSDYNDVFDSDGSSETIFEIDFTELDRNRIAEYNFPKTLNGRREVAPAEDLINAYETGDERKDVSIAYDGVNAYANKYNDLSKGADNVIILRLAEMYLIRAEAEANNNGNVTNIQNDLNKIRTRANLGLTNASNISNLLIAIEKERRVEFAFEGHRWFDLARTGRAVEVLSTVYSINQTLFPIPSEELQTNNSPDMYQNQGYF